MKFDIKDVKSWYNRHDVKVGDEGYFADSIEELKTEDNLTRTIENIFDDDYCSANCGEIHAYGNDKDIADRYTGYIVTDIYTEKIGGIRDCIYITIQNPKDFDC